MGGLAFEPFILQTRSRRSILQGPETFLGTTFLAMMQEAPAPFSCEDAGRGFRFWSLSASLSLIRSPGAREAGRLRRGHSASAGERLFICRRSERVTRPLRVDRKLGARDGRKRISERFSQHVLRADENRGAAKVTVRSGEPGEDGHAARHAALRSELLVQIQTLQQQGPYFGKGITVQERVRPVAQTERNVLFVPELAKQVDALAMREDRGRRIAGLEAHQGEVVERERDATTIAGPPEERQALFQQLARLSELAALARHIGKATERRRLASRIADLPPKRQRFLVSRPGLLVVPLTIGNTRRSGEYCL
jgi:hypothetical protein